MKPVGFVKLQYILARQYDEFNWSMLYSQLKHNQRKRSDAPGVEK